MLTCASPRGCPARKCIRAGRFAMAYQARLDRFG
jgi:hypothetical protein